jgi:hypothetical protein
MQQSWEGRPNLELFRLRESRMAQGQRGLGLWEGLSFSSAVRPGEDRVLLPMGRQYAGSRESSPNLEEP